MFATGRLQRVLDYVPEMSPDSLVEVLKVATNTIMEIKTKVPDTLRQLNPEEKVCISYILRTVADEIESINRNILPQFFRKSKISSVKEMNGVIC